MTFAPLQTERLALRRFTRSDARALTELAGAWEVARHTARIPHPLGPLAAESWIDGTRADMAAGAAFVFAVERRSDGALLGSASLGLDATRGGAELAYWLGRDRWGRGYATEAAARLVGLAFQTLGVGRVWAAAHDDNRASMRVLRKSGLRFERSGSLHLPARGGAAAVDFHGLDRRDWRPAPEPGTLPTLYVGAAALIDADDRVLIAQRPPGKAMAGLWEFPGGKIEPGEVPAITAARELGEELGIEMAVDAVVPFTIASHRYPDFHLLMPLLICRHWAGIPRAREHQALDWVPAWHLDARSMPPADAPLVRELQTLLCP